MRIYVDLVAILNTVVDFLLILGTNRWAGFPPDSGRGAAAAVVGGVYGGACLIPNFTFLGNPFWRAVSLGIIAVIAFGWNRSALQRGGIFVLLSMALGGIAIGMGQGSVMMLILSALLMWLMERLLGRSLKALVASMIAGLLVCYAFGTAWFMVVYARDSGSIGLITALSWCVFPYIIPDALKILLAAVMTRRLRPLIIG